MSHDLSQHIALVTGAAGGIGQHIVQGLLNAGACVIASDVSESALAALSATLTVHHSDRFKTLPLDISDSAACESLIEQVATDTGNVDILINNAAMGMGVIRDDHMTRLVDIEEISPDLWDQFVKTNLSGAWYLTRAVAPFMKQHGWGRIITVTTSMFTMLRGRFHPYGPTKAGLEAMSAGHAEEFNGSGITVNVVVPGGPADTAMVPEQSGMARHELIPPAAMVAPIAWLCTRDADDVTGYRYIAAKWDENDSIERARQLSEAPIAWPDLAAAPVWPGGKPKSHNS